MTGSRYQVTYKKATETLSSAARKVDKTDFPLRMRNQMAGDLRPKEIVNDDDYAAVTQGAQLSRRAAKKSAPRFALIIVTNERLRIITADDEEMTDVRLGDIRLTHDEDGALTMMIRISGRPAEPLTLVFGKRRSPVAAYLRDQFEADKPGGSSKTRLRRLLPGQ